MKEQALSVRHVRVHFELPTRLAENDLEAFGEGGLQGALDPLAAGCHERFQAGLALFFARSPVWHGVTAKSEDFLVPRSDRCPRKIAG